MAKNRDQLMQKSPDHDKFMKRAIALSKENIASTGGGPFGAVLVKNNNVIGEGRNQVTSNFDPTAHAEIQAIRMACKVLGHFSLEGAVLYTSCEPCPMCLAAIYWARVDTIYYANTRKDAAKIGFDDELIYLELAKPIKERAVTMVQSHKKEAMSIFTSWLKKTDKLMY